METQISVQAGVLCLGMKTNSSSGYLGLHNHPSTRSGTATDRSTEVQNETPTKIQLADQENLLFRIRRAYLQTES